MPYNLANANHHSQIHDDMLKILSDGNPHRREELHACCGPSSLRVVRAHLSVIRKKLTQGQDIVCVLRNRQICYQWVRTVGSANTGRR